MIRETIILAALRLFLVRGYKYVSLNDVAHEVGITKGGIYHYFASKEKLLHEAIHFLFDKSEDKYIHVLKSGESLRSTLHALIVDRELDRYAEKLFGLEGDDWFSYANLALEAMRMFPDIRSRVDQFYIRVCGEMERKIGEAATKGEIRGDVDSRSLAVMILATIEGQSFHGPGSESPDMRKGLMEGIWKLIKA